MAYSKNAKNRRRCTHVFGPDHDRAGDRCKAYAMWDSAEGLCAAHAGRTRGAQRSGAPYRCRTTPKCTCPAYAWPHRPGGGLCNWPDPPDETSPIPEGTPTENKPERDCRDMTWPTTYRRVDVPQPHESAREVRSENNDR